MGFVEAMLLRYGMLGVLLVLVVVAVILYPGFLEPANLRDILSQNSAVGIIAVGMTLILLTGGFDLSVGATFALSGTVFAGVALSQGVMMGSLAGLAAGLAAGLVNGLLVAVLNVNPFVATLGSSSVISGLAYIYSNSAPFIVEDIAFRNLGVARVAGIPLPVVILVLTFIVGWFLVHRTTYGRNIFAVGGNREAARLSGLPVAALVISTYVITGLLAGLAGMISASRLGVGQADVGSTIALDVIAVVVIGGTSLLGGEGAIWRTVVGLLILATLTNVFFSLNVDQNWQLIAKGLIIVGAVALDAYLRKREAQ
jgi:ribose/xylose/arabinose/galactoside ABC-type transport system permease subunit